MQQVYFCITVDACYSLPICEAYYIQSLSTSSDCHVPEDTVPTPEPECLNYDNNCKISLRVAG